MAQVYHLHCRHCGETLEKSVEPYCPRCNIYLFYRAMPILLGMLLTAQPLPVRPAAARAPRRDPKTGQPYAHLRYIMD